MGKKVENGFQIVMREARKTLVPTLYCRISGLRLKEKKMAIFKRSAGEAVLLGRVRRLSEQDKKNIP